VSREEEGREKELEAQHQEKKVCLVLPLLLHVAVTFTRLTILTMVHSSKKQQTISTSFGAGGVRLI
jgi:hypothetical protein